MNTQDCYYCQEEVNLNDDKYYFFENEEVACAKCCEKEGLVAE